ncbi:MAG: hypothetical protein QM718_08230 [Steroidobacteraceae bacterium]
MVAITDLWIAILLSAVALFIISSFIHMALPYHWNDYGRLDNQDAVLDALKGLDLPAGDYMMPKALRRSDMGSAEEKEKRKKYPMVMMTVVPNCDATMGSALICWFAYLLVVGLCCAYLATRVLPGGAPYLEVFRVTGFTAFMAYALAFPIQSIWYQRNWRPTVLMMFDGLIYALITGGMFGWLWPR